jgi:hypothetical protein
MFYYMYGRGYVARHELRVRQGVEDFLDIEMSGTGILLTGEFIIMKSGKIITVPIDGAPEENLENLVFPRGYQPLRLPDDIEETTNNQFGFILRNGGGNNYTLNVRGLDTYEVAKMAPSSESGTAFMNTSGRIKENTWYKVVAKISEDEVTAQLHDANGTVIESIASPADKVNVNELVILLANNTDRAVAFKNLNVETLNQSAQPVEEDGKDVDVIKLLAPYATFAILVATVFAAAVYVKKRKHARGYSR